MRTNSSKVLVQLSMITTAVMFFYGYAMVHVKAIDKANYPIVGTSEQKTVEPTIWQSFTQIWADQKKQTNQQDTTKTEYLVRNDKKKQQEIKIREKKKKKHGCIVQFPDVAGHTFEDSIVLASENCLIGGHTNGKFYPDNHIKYNDLLCLLSKGYSHTYNKEISREVIDEVITKKYDKNQALTYKQIRIILDDLQTIQSFDIGQDVKAIQKGDNEIVTRAETVFLLTKIFNREKRQEDKTEQYVQNTTPDDVNQIHAQQNLNAIKEQNIAIHDPTETVSRSTFLSLVVQAKQQTNPSIPKSLQWQQLFIDVNEDNPHAQEINIAKTMGITSFLEHIQRGESTLFPEKNITLYEAETVIQESGGAVIPDSKNDTILITHAKAQELVETYIYNKNNTNGQYTANQEVVNQTTNNENDPWLVKQLKPAVQHITTLW